MKSPAKTFIHMDGHLIPADQFYIESLRPGVLSGQGVFETIKISGGRILLLPRHLNRLFHGLKDLKLKFPYVRSRIRTWMMETLKANELTDARVRLTVWEKNGIIKCSIIAQPLEPPSPRDYEQGWKAMMSSIRRNEESPLSHIKSINYRTFLEAYLQAKRKGCQEAILLNRRGQIAEGSRTNVFVIKGKILLTPPLKCGCLPGIMRQLVLTLARQLRVKARQAELMPEDLLSADEAFVTNALIGIVPLARLDGRKIGSGHAGPVTARLQKALQKFT